ncbi:flavin-dependent amine oxidoreductase [Methylobacter tundripaludum]|uniref:Tryptophan 2-monooxygenase n=1 Tax=Methylobacter tundripaludum TaxID=173365 RepID=A0A2S6HEW5_9GAMM|nr:FAD-dependent oxidoreductase [Methylobacter tundripaludum]PPK75931.1 flavin-dependent amine oxidoreductase [Methylobacter tundripaludum]
MITPEYDLAVVGGGVAGLYCGMHAAPDWRVALFEGSHRLGGKLETVSMLGFDAEYGAMRFDPVRQSRMGELINELGIETLPFPEYSSPPDQQHNLNYRLDADEQGLTTLELYKLAIQRVLGMSEAEMLVLSEQQLESIRRESIFFGQPLWEQGLWNTLGRVISHNALRYIVMEGSFFHFIHENPNAATWLITWVKMLQMSPNLRTIRHGMQSLADAMQERLHQRGAEIHRARVLTSLERYDRERLLLHFSEGQTCIAKHVVLALPEHCLVRINGLPPGIRSMFGSVLDIPLLKCFFVVEDPWWDEDIPHLDMPNLPAREVHYQKRDGKGLVMVYADRPYLNFWSQYLRKGYETRAEINGDPGLPLAFSRFMGIDPKRIVSYGIRHWGTEPYGAACHLWKPGVKPWTVQEKVAAFSLERNGPANLYICGEAFSDYQGFIEGALRTAHDVMGRMAAT